MPMHIQPMQPRTRSLKDMLGHKGLFSGSTVACIACVAFCDAGVIAWLIRARTKSNELLFGGGAELENICEKDDEGAIPGARHKPCEQG
eukprot:CAMPEP_0119075258 /NCGR_PEP_ID=MMETSP1178-20130426/78574_1 /TAXON_ID=33656 /ORGANISM="unid sp, Strain CCMP2000" /LENGTH=88 /DNA_ID=CAMNT_0007057471 /DNA_START=609 /DNA_END=875 /DNA_ORIENTATION=-